MRDTSTMTIRLDSALKSRLDQLAEATERSRSFLAAEAVREFVELNEWQIQETTSGVKEADAGDFADADEVRDVFLRWGVSGD